MYIRLLSLILTIATESQRTENSPEDIGEPWGPSEIQRAKRGKYH